MIEVSRGHTDNACCARRYRRQIASVSVVAGAILAARPKKGAHSVSRIDEYDAKYIGVFVAIKVAKRTGQTLV